MNKEIKKLFDKIGVSEWGICAVDGLPDFLPVRSAERLPDNPRCVICALFPYNITFSPQRNICKYAVFTDYHITVVDALRGVCEDLCEKYTGKSFVCFSDASPVPEVAAASLCGLGAVGKNGMLINKKYGSYCFIGTIVTDADLETACASRVTCLECNRCVSACPTAALRTKDYTKCLSAVTQKKGKLTDSEMKLIKAGGLVWGCDVCQDVCPMNKGTGLSPLEYITGGRREIISRENCFDDFRTRAYSFRGKGVIERNMKILGIK